jgi:hypothetical protein
MLLESVCILQKKWLILCFYYCSFINSRYQTDAPHLKWVPTFMMVSSIAINHRHSESTILHSHNTHQKNSMKQKEQPDQTKKVFNWYQISCIHKNVSLYYIIICTHVIIITANDITITSPSYLYISSSGYSEHRGFFGCFAVYFVLWILLSQSSCCSCLFLCGIPGIYIPGFCYDELFVGLLYLYCCMTLLGDVVWVLDDVVCSIVVTLHLCFVY